MPTYHLWTIGCQMNRAESERLAARFSELGYAPAEDIAAADLIVLNTCVVRGSAESRVVNKLHLLRRLKKTHPNAVIAVTGCFVDADLPKLKKTYPHIDYFFKAGDYPPWLEKQSALPSSLTPQPSSLLPISQGCDNFCTYCIVPFRRGRERSRPFTEIICEAGELVRRGAKEIVLLGQNVDSYGHDLEGKPDLAALLTELNKIQGLRRIRFLTNHPKDMSLKLIRTIARLEKVCRQMNLPVQAGSDTILTAMKRGYTADQYRRLVAQIREDIPDMAVSTDVIIGFPGETEDMFQETLDLLTEIKFDTVHVAAYSPREGTAAARTLADDVPVQVKKERLARVEILQEEIQTGLNACFLGQTVEVLVEDRRKGKWFGRTCSDKLVFFNSKQALRGQIVNIKIEKTSPWSLQGKMSTDKTVQEEK